MRAIKSITVLVRRTVLNWNRHNTALLGAGISYYALFSLPPLLLILTAVTGAVFGPAAAQGVLVHNVERFVGAEMAGAIEKLVLNAEKSGVKTAGILGILLLLYGASNLFQQLVTALNVIWEPQKRKAGFGRAIVSMLKKRAINFMAVLSFGLLLFLLFLTDAVLSILKHFLDPALPFLSGLGVWQAAAVAASVVLLGILLAAMYRYLPDIYVRWSDALVGAAFSSVGIALCRVLISLYFRLGGARSVYQVAGSLLVLLVGIHFGALIFLAGAELAAARAEIHRQLSGGTAAKPVLSQLP